MKERLALLTIDDEEPIRRSIRIFFEDLGYEVWEAEDGETGLSIFRDKAPSAVLVDLRMPGISGLDVIDALAAEAPEAPVVVLSGTGIIGDAIEAIRRGAWDYVTKPIVDMAELEHVVNGVLEKARLREESRRYHEHLEGEVAQRTNDLRESEEKYRELVENMSDVLYAIDTHGVVTYVSPVTEAFAGYRPGEVRGRYFRDFILPQHWARVEKKFLEALKGSPMAEEFMILKSSSEPIWVRASSRPVRRGDRVVGIQGILTDITERKNAELQLETKAGELAMLNSLGRDMGADLSVESAVKTALEHTLHSAEPDVSMLFLREGELLRLRGLLPHRGPLTRDDVPIHRVGECLCGLAAAESRAVYSRDIHADPRCTFAECKRAVLKSFAALPLVSGGEVIGVLGIVSRAERDFMERSSFLDAFGNEVAMGLKNAILYEKAQADAIELQRSLMQIREAEAEKESLTAQLQQAQKMEAIGTLAGGIAHDFNNILTPIIMGTEMALASVPVENMAYPLLRKVLDAGVRAKDLVQQILTFSRQSDLEMRPLRLTPLLKESLKLARSTLPASIEIRQRLGVERDMIMANPTQIHQVMMNMFTNAAHAMREGGGILEVALQEEFLDEASAAKVPELTAGRFLRLSVRDTGHGMDRRTMDQIFDPFFTTKERGEGTGLGLSIVHGIVRSCRGVIRVESQIGKGTTFTLYFPVVGRAFEEQREDSKPIPGGMERILLVDDEDVIVEISGNMLRRLGYTVDSRVDPLSVLDTFEKDPGRYDLVITDMNMPKMRGDKLAAELMRIRPDIPIILCTGFSEQMSEAIACEMGIRAFVMKPIVIGDIARKIRRVLENKI